MSYLVYLNYYNIRQVEAQYLSVLYEILGKGLDATFLLSKEYLLNYENKNRWEVNWAKTHWGDYSTLLRKLTPDKYLVMDKPEEFIARDSAREEKVPSEILSASVSREFVYERKQVIKAIEQHDIQAGVTWVNNRCFSATLRDFDIPTIHHELGPFRIPTYIPTAFLDFHGVNGGTEFNSRFARFLKIAKDVPILSRKELIKVISPVHYKELWQVLENTRYTYEAGVGLQVEVDTNVLLFNKGYNWIDPLLMAQAQTTGKVLVRPHPMASYTLKQNNRIVIDDVVKTKAYEFINKCKRVYCLNSSVGIESILLGRQAVILGDNPFMSVCDMDEETQLKALNFIVFGYLIHRDLLFNNEYYEFRLKNKGNEKLIYLDNLDRLLKSSLKKG